MPHTHTHQRKNYVPIRQFDASPLIVEKICGQCTSSSTLMFPLFPSELAHCSWNEKGFTGSASVLVVEADVDVGDDSFGPLLAKSLSDGDPVARVSSSLLPSTPPRASIPKSPTLMLEWRPDCGCDRELEKEPFIRRENDAWWAANRPGNFFVMPLSVSRRK